MAESLGVEYLLALSAIGIYFHAIFVSITLGFPLAIMALLFAYSRTGASEYMRAARILTYVLAVNFALGAITGTLVEFGLVQVWPGTIAAIASFFFAPLALELIAFANEIAFLILFIVTLGRVRPMISILILGVYWVFAVYSGLLITTVNSWMNVPWGVATIPGALYPFLPEYGPLAVDAQKLVALKILLLASGLPLQEIIQTPEASNVVGIILNDPYIAFYSLYAWVSVAHNIVAALIVGLSIALLGFSYRLYKSKDVKYAQIIRVFYPILLILILIQPTIIGHYMGVNVAYYNPVKFAMMEGAYTTYHNPIIGFLAYGDPNHPIIGFDRFYASCREQTITLGELANSLGLTRENLLEISNNLGIKLDTQRLDNVLSTKVSDVCIGDLKSVEPKIRAVNIAYYTKIFGGVIAFISAILLAGVMYRIPLVSSISRRLVNIIGRGDYAKSIFILTILIALGVALAAVLGWYVREVGRKPWTIYGLIYPSEVITVVDYARTLEFTIFASAIIIAINVAGIYAMYIVASRHAVFTQLLERFLSGRR
ncbi:MAG: cytochrome ubiquinol oxidase subunit I [Acidilobaceae archaeon]